MKSAQEFTWKEQYEQKQTQYLSQLQQFSLHMLCMPASEIDLTIIKEIEENPMVEFEEHAALSAGNEYNRNQIEQLAQTRTLFDELKQQLALIHGCNMDIADLILMNLDAHGFLADACIDDFIKAGYSRRIILDTIEKLKICEPAGLGCRDVKDFILFQLQRLCDPDPTAIRIVEHYLELFYFNRQSERLLLALQCSREELLRAEASILSCQPYPAQLQDDFAYIQPDVTITLQPALCIEIRQPCYRLKPSSIAMQYEYREYAKAYVSRIRQINNAITMRNTTLYHIMEYIIQEQEEFFYRHGTLRPLTMQEAGTRLHMHKSTISRAVCDKHVQVQDNVYPMRIFFNNDPLHCGHTQQSIALQIRQIIEQEQSPWKDEEIAKALQHKGIRISRRTVSKYRQRMGVDNYKSRRGYHERKDL